MSIAAQTVLAAVRSEFPDSTIRYEQGCAVTGHERNGLAAAIEAACDADLTILAVGDRSGMFGHGASGEGCDVATLDLPGIQAELVDEVSAAARKTLLILLSGRPYAIGRHAKNAAATIQAFFPGQEGAAATTGVLSGRISPSGLSQCRSPATPRASPARTSHPLSRSRATA